jgi:hypothetical protein
MSIECAVCNVLLKSEKCMQSHRKSKRHIDKVNNTTQLPNYTCGCGKNYTYRQSLHVHRRTCTSENPVLSKPILIKVTDSMRIVQLENTLHEERKLREQFQKESDELRLQVSLLLDRHTTQINTTNSNNKNSHNTKIGTQNIIINVNAFGNENVDYIDDKAILACIGRVYKSIPSLLEKIHFDPNHPENHNIKITNKKLKYASVMGDNQKWKTVDRKDAIDKMVLNGYNMLDEKYSENKDKIPETKQQNFEGFQSKFESEDKDLMKQIKTEVDMMVLNR